MGTRPQYVNHFRYPFTEDKRDKSPAQQAQSSPKLSGINPPDEPNEKNQSQDEEDGIKLFHGRLAFGFIDQMFSASLLLFSWAQ